MLVGQGLRPAADQAAGVGLEGGVRGVDPDFGARDARVHTLGLAELRGPCSAEQHHGLDQALDVEELARGRRDS